MTFSESVGVSFHEAMSGTLVSGYDDPDKAVVAAAGRPSNFKFSVLVDIASVRRFLDAPAHVAALTRGAVSWQGVCRPDTPIVSGGTIQMYRHLRPDGTEKDFRFTFGFRGDDGAWYVFDGQKRLKSGDGSSVLEDLSRVFARVQRDGRTVAAGVTTVHFDELVEQVVSMNTSGATDLGEQLSAPAALFSFMNDELKQVYPGIPRFFDTDERRYLRPSEQAALTFVAQAMLPDPLPSFGPSVDDTVANVQSFVRSASVGTLDEIRNLLRILGTFTPLFNPKHVRAFLRAHMTPTSTALLNVVDQLKAAVAVPYYAHPKADAVVGYKRPTFLKTLQTRLDVHDAPPPGREYDYVIAGAGVAGSLLAARLTAAGSSVLLLDAGPYQPESEISTDEIRMTARLYKSGGLQATRQSMPVLQAWCVGGGGVINNAICFQLPADRLARWRRSGFSFDETAMRAAYAAVAKDLSIQPVSLATKYLNPALRFLSPLGPAQVPQVDRPPPTGLSECLVNLHGCDGLGLCNTGCGNERKRNSFQVYLKQALATGRCTLVAEASVTGITLDAHGAVASMQVDARGHRYAVRAKRDYILAAGAVASSAILLDSDVWVRHAHLPIGRRFSANVGCPTFVFTKTPIHTGTSLQISHAWFPAGGDGFVIESWFAPPGTFALTMPGYFEQHAERMRRYAQSTVLAPLVGVEPTGVVSLEGGGRPVVDLTVSNDDVRRLVAGAAKIARAAISSGAPEFDHVLLGSRFGTEARREEDVSAFEHAIAAPSQLRLGTGHPQGGNALSDDAAISVVDGDFRVRGVGNLRVCDASVFPDSAGVNPQWTVMALAHLCAQRL